MKSPFDDTSNSNTDLSDTETQPPDDEFSPPASPRGEFENESWHEDELQDVQDTVPVDDVTAYGKAFETQLVDADEEILALDLGNETQVLTLAGETQVVEELHCLENICTQVLDKNDVEDSSDSDGEGTDKTEALCDTQEVSDDNSVNRGSSFLKMGSYERRNEVSKPQIDASSDRKHQSGSVHMDFTSIRAASIRAGGLAARERALQRANGKSSSITDCPSLKECATEHTAVSDVRDCPNSGKEINQDGNNEQMNELRIDNRSNVCSSTVRKLFSEDTTAETQQVDDAVTDFNDAADLAQIYGLENGLAGLSYINSQEPGELSQANALEVVDRFLKFNVIDCDHGVDNRKSVGGKTKVFPSAKGTQKLAKRNILETSDGENGIFDWDDNREDEGGGEFFRRKKDLLFNNGDQKQKSFTQPRKPRCRLKVNNTVKDCRDEEEEHKITKKILKDAVHSDSRVYLRKTRGNSKSSKPREELRRKLDDELTTASGIGLPNGTGKNQAVTLDVGPDTQIAAEAMETLCFGLVVPENTCSNGIEGERNIKRSSRRAETGNRVQDEHDTSLKKAHSLNTGHVTRRSKRIKKNSAELSREGSCTLAYSEDVRKQCASELVKAQPKKPGLDAEKCCAEDGGGNLANCRYNVVEERKDKRASRASGLDKSDECNITAFTFPRKKTKCVLREQSPSSTPVAHRTRRRREVSQSSASKESHDLREENNDLAGSSSCRKKSKIHSSASGSLTKENTNHAVELRDERSVCNVLSDSKVSGKSGALKFDAADCPKGRRTCKKRTLNTQVAKAHYNTRSATLKTDACTTSMDVHNVNNATACTSTEVKISAEGAEAAVGFDSTPRDGCEASSSACTTPPNCRTPINAASPICMGDEYNKRSCGKRLPRSPLMKELCSLIEAGSKLTVTDSRRRRDMAQVRVLFSHHLDADIIKQQKKILTRLGASEASSMPGATHFITDKFVRTRNMLEAIALGKPVVTDMWLESCGQASCFIDEKNFILRDARKEKEIGFSMPASLARARHHPLLQGQRVLITPNTKPSTEILASLVKAVCGLPVERLGRSALKDEKLPDDLLIMSCEEDYEISMPFLERGAAIYSSELLLNGIVIQKLEYERHRLFLDHIKRTRSTIWVKKDNQYLPVTPCA